MNKEMKQITNEQHDEIKYILGLSKIVTGDVHKMQSIMAELIDSSVNVCTTCPAQIRFAHNRLKNWYIRYNVKFPMTEEVVEEVKTIACRKCGDQFEPATKRNKYCNKCKTK